MGRSLHVISSDTGDVPVGAQGVSAQAEWLPSEQLRTVISDRRGLGGPADRPEEAAAGRTASRVGSGPSPDYAVAASQQAGGGHD